MPLGRVEGGSSSNPSTGVPACLRAPSWRGAGVWTKVNSRRAPLSGSAPLLCDELLSGSLETGRVRM